MCLKHWGFTVIYKPRLDPRLVALPGSFSGGGSSSPSVALPALVLFAVIFYRCSGLAAPIFEVWVSPIRSGLASARTALARAGGGSGGGAGCRSGIGFYRPVGMSPSRLPGAL